MSVNQSWICSSCGAELPTKKDYLEHLEAHKSGVKQPVADPVVTEKVPSEIELMYVFKGHCPKCSGQISTLEIDVDKKHFVIAHCTRCNKQLKTKEVATLKG